MPTIPMCTPEKCCRWKLTCPKIEYKWVLPPVLNRYNTYYSNRLRVRVAWHREKSFSLLDGTIGSLELSAQIKMYKSQFNEMKRKICRRVKEFSFCWNESAQTAQKFSPSHYFCEKREENANMISDVPKLNEFICNLIFLIWLKRWRRRWRWPPHS